MLLDEVGRLLAVAPATPSLLGQDLTRRYELLRLGVAGQVTVSRAELSVARRRPVVAFSVPYETPHGRRVFSGAYELATIPLADYLGRAVPTASATLYLVDPGGVVVASNRQLPEGLAGLGSLDLALRVDAPLYQPVDGPGRWVPWLVLVAFAGRAAGGGPAQPAPGQPCPGGPPSPSGSPPGTARRPPTSWSPGPTPPSTPPRRVAATATSSPELA